MVDMSSKYRTAIESIDEDIQSVVTALNAISSVHLKQPHNDSLTDIITRLGGEKAVLEYKRKEAETYLLDNSGNNSFFVKVDNSDKAV